MQHDVIIACDFKSAEDTFRFLDLFKDEERKPFLKIGMELFYAEGPAIVREIKRRGHRIFLDLKLHDIPNTVKKAMAVLSRLDVDMCNVHAAGTIEMMRAAREGLTREDGTRPLLIAVTQLTSTSEERMREELLIDASINDTIVIFDRIREYIALYPKRSLRDNINNATNSTMARTFNSSGTTLVTLLAIFLFGGLAKSGKYIFEPTQWYMEENMMSVFKNKVKLLPSGIQSQNAAILGASALIWQEVKQLGA